MHNTIKVKIVPLRTIIAKCNGYLALYGDAPFNKPTALGVDKEQKP